MRSDDYENYRIRPTDITVSLLVALGHLSLPERSAWLDTYILGVPQRKAGSYYVSEANKKLRVIFGSPSALIEAS